MDWNNVAIVTLPDFLLLGQDAAPAGGNSAVQDFFGSGYGMLVPLMVIFAAFYFMILLPERKRRKEQESLLGGLKKNDRVVTSAGIIGVVVMAEKGSKQVTIRIDEKTDAKMTLLRSAISQVIQDDVDIDAKKSS